MKLVLALRQSKRCMLLLAAGLIACAAPTGSRAQGKLEAQYTATLAGIPIGKGHWRIDISDTQYKAAAGGSTTGLIRVFLGGQGSSTAHGALQAGRPTSSIYSSTIKTRQKDDEVRLKIDNGDLLESKVEPPQDREPDRVPLTPAHRHGILDPMTASLMVVPGTAQPLSPEACRRTVAIFDGRMRYDLQLTFKRMETVKAEKGYAGNVLVCAVRFSPIAGYIPSRSAIKYIAEQHDIEVWLAPIEGTRVLVPFRAQSPTPIGEAVLTATQFVTVAGAARASAGGAKTQ
jgi:Protein of unknown function (DUF3108)